MKWFRALAASSLLVPVVSFADFVTSGRPVDPEKSLSLRAQVGQVSEIKGSVTETSRRLFELQGRDPSTYKTLSYSFEELGLTESDITYGVSLEKNWRYFTFRSDFSYMQASASGVPPRDFFIGVDKIYYKGQKYEYMKLEDNVPYDASLDAAIIDLRLQYTPFTLGEEYTIAFTPMLQVGLFGLAGTFEADQGPALRTQIYENPPHEYVVGGHGEGTLAGFAPSIGFGGELRFWLGRNDFGDREIAVQGTYAIFKFNGSSQTLGINARNDKDLDVDYSMIDLRVQYSHPLSAAVDLLFGAEFKSVSTEASSKSKAKTLAEAEINREKFDKDIDMDLTMFNFFAGIRF